MTSSKESRLPPPGDDALLEVGDDGFEESLQRQYRIVWWTTLIAPFVLTVSLIALLRFVKGAHYINKLLVAAPVTFFGGGRFVILLGGDSEAVGKSTGVFEFFSPEELFLMVVYLDLITAMLLVFHMKFMFKLPLLGGKLRELANDGRLVVMSYPWIRRTTMMGVIAFVMFPLAATGSIGGSILGRMLGLSRLTTFACVMIGSALGCGVMYFGAGLITTYLPRDNPLVKFGGIGAIVAVIIYMNFRYRKMKADRRAEMASAERENQ